jgi:uncharacterized membrane protein YkvA (DUF1232 family)
MADSPRNVSDGLVERACALLADLPEVSVTLKGFCVSYDSEDVLRLRDKLIDFAEWSSSFTADRLGPDMNLASELCSRAVTILERYDSFTEDQRALAVGAVRYLVFRVDAVPDRRGRSGIEDDKRVVNTALPLLGLHDRVIPHTIVSPQKPGEISNQSDKQQPQGLKDRKARWKSFRRLPTSNSSSSD